MRTEAAKHHELNQKGLLLTFRKLAYFLRMTDRGSMRLSGDNPDAQTANIASLNHPSFGNYVQDE